MVKTLVDLCTAVCIRNIKEITDVGSMPYSVLRPTLLRIDSAAQLRQLEIASPHLEGDDSECWLRLVKKDFPVLSKRNNYEPKNPASWHKVYAKYQRLEAEQKAAAVEKLKNAFGAIKKEKADNVSQVVTYDRRKLPRPPREGRSLAGIRKPGMGRADHTGGLRFTGGSKTKTTTGRSILMKAKREAKEITMRNRLMTPTGRLQVRSGQIERAPPGMVQEHIHKARPLGGVRPPQPRPSLQAHDRELEDREERLRKMKNANAKKGANFISDDELEEEDDLDVDDGDMGGDGGGLDEDDLEDLFDEKPKPAPARPAQSATRQTHSQTSFGPPSTASASAPTSTTRPVASTTKTGILSRKLPGALGSSSAGKVRVVSSPNPAAQPATKPAPSQHPKAASPPLGADSSPPKTSAPAPSSSSGSSNPMVQRKRKATNVFMTQKNKVARH